MITSEDPIEVVYLRCDGSDPAFAAKKKQLLAKMGLPWDESNFGELRYIAKERPSILSELQVLWDEELSQQNILLILCGSAVSFIAKEVLGEKNPLYGRAGTIMKVRPLPFQTVAEFVPSYSADDIFRGYASLGGIPYF